MPVLSRYRIASFQDVQIDQPAGLVNDGQFSTYTLDDPAITPGGTGDFLGVIKTSVLLGRLVKEEIDTRRYTIAALNNLTVEQYEEEILNGNIIRNPRSRTNSAEEIGWVELGRSRASFYYKDCTVNGNRGKQPTAEFFYTLGTFNLDGKILRGVFDPDGRAVYFGAPALEQIGAYNQVDVLNNFGILGPNFAPMDINEYMSHALAYKIIQRPTARGFRNDPGWYFPNGNGEYLSGNGYRSEQLSNIQLLLATKSEHFDNELTQPYSSGVWARSRETAQGVRVSGNLDFRTVDRFSGLCLPLEEIVVPDDGDDETGIGDEEEKWYGGGDTTKIDEDYEQDEEGEDTEEDFVTPSTADIPDLSCDRNAHYLLKINYYPYDQVSESEKSGSNVFFGGELGAPSGSIIYSDLSEDGESDTTILDIFKDDLLDASGIIDPRDFSGNTLSLPRGTIKGIHNIKKCTIDVYKSFRDKDGDRPEFIGPIVSRYLEDLRNSMMKVFGTENPLKLIGYGTDGYEYYSDGNSYTELHGESVFGCGKSFTIADVPEIFTEMYPVKVDHPFYGKYGKDENDFVKNYRVNIERPSDFPAWMLDTMDWLLNLPAKFTDPRMRVSDLFDDLVLGVPDMDMAIVGRNAESNDDNILKDFVNNLYHEISTEYSAIGRLLSDHKVYEEKPEHELTASQIYSRIEELRKKLDEEESLDISEKEELYKYLEILPYIFAPKTEVDELKNNLPKRISRYKKFENIWNRKYLNLVYARNEEQAIQLLQDASEINKKGVDQVSLEYVNHTRLELLYLKSKLAVPSRWKAMMRPIYENLWYDKNAIKPENVATEPYVIGTSIFELELGNYENHRMSYGNGRNLYDIIDDIISLQINESTFENYEPSSVVHSYSVLLDVDTIFGTIANPKISKDVHNLVREFTLAYEDLKNLAKKPENLSSYTRLAESAIRSYSTVAKTIKDIGTIINGEQLPEGFAGPPGPPGSFLNTDIVGFLSHKAVAALNLTIQNALSWAQQEFNRVQPDRSSFSPRRVFKSGDVYLESKSGLFSTNKQPCPIIFLGFNDYVIASSFDSFNETGGCIDFLYKNDKISSIKYMREVDFINPTDRDLISLGGANLGNTSFGGNLEGARMRYGKIEDIPAINRRFRQYGRNPLFDIFYLNMVPEAVRGTATPEPFRYPRVEQQKQQLRSKKVVYSYVPSIFPPHWNEPIVKDGPPMDYEKDNSIYLHGDLQDFHYRRRNNILTASERWAMRVDMVGKAPVVVLKDKTRILDIYYGLMKMHVLGFGWAEIREYANQARKAVKIQHLDKKSIMQPNGTPIQLEMGSNEEKSKIDLDSLEKLWDKISARLDNSSPLYISKPEKWVAPTLNNVRDIINSLSSKNRNVFFKTIKIYNNTVDTVKIKSIEIIPDTDSDYDFFGQKSNNLFYYSLSGIESEPDGPIIEISEIENEEGTLGITKSVSINGVNITNNLGDIPLLPLPPSFTETGTYQGLTIWFIPYGAQSSYTYRAKLKIISEWGGEEYINSTELIGTAYAESINSISEGYSEPLTLPDHLIFGNINNLDLYDEVKGAMEVQYLNNSNEDVVIESFEITDERITDFTGEDRTRSIVSFQNSSEPDFFIFEGVSSPDQTGQLEEESSSEKSISVQIVASGKKPGVQTVDYNSGPKVKINKSAMLSNGTYRSQMIYTAQLTVNYSLKPRSNSVNTIKKSTTCTLVFNTRET